MLRKASSMLRVAPVSRQAQHLAPAPRPPPRLPPSPRISLLRLGAAAGPAGALGVRRAVVLTASVKTLPVAVAVLSALGPGLGPAAGAAVLPVVIAHLAQIWIDSVLVARWLAKERDDGVAAAAAAAATESVGAVAARGREAAAGRAAAEADSSVAAGGSFWTEAAAPGGEGCGPEGRGAFAVPRAA
jgi:hypothetical protein